MRRCRRPFTAANRELAINSDQIVESMIKDLTQSDIISQVKRAIIDSLPSGTPSEEDIAKRAVRQQQDTAAQVSR